MEPDKNATAGLQQLSCTVKLERCESAFVIKVTENYQLPQRARGFFLKSTSGCSASCLHVEALLNSSLCGKAKGNTYFLTLRLLL